MSNRSRSTTESVHYKRLLLERQGERQNLKPIPTNPIADFGIEIGGNRNSQRFWTIRQIADERLKNPKLYFTLRKIFLREEGVVNFGNGKRNQFLLVPDAVLERVLAERANRMRRRS